MLFFIHLIEFLVNFMLWFYFHLIYFFLLFLIFDSLGLLLSWIDVPCKHYCQVKRVKELEQKFYRSSKPWELVWLMLKSADFVKCWIVGTVTRTVIESTVFKDALAVFYGCARTTNTDLKCMLTGNFYPRPEVRASQIIKRSTNGDTMHLYGLPPNIDHVRNGLLLLEPIEQAFDRKCYVQPAGGKSFESKLDERAHA